MTRPDQTPVPERQRGPASTSSLAGLMAPMQCALSTIDAGYELRLSGMTIDRILPLLAIHEETDASNLLVGFDPDDSNPAIEPTGLVPGPQRVSEEFLQRIAWIVQINGPVENRDAQALHQAWEQGACLLAAELRATMSVVLQANGVLVLRTEEKDVLLQAAGELLREHVSRQSSRALPRIASPELGLMHALLAISGTLSVRPIETQSYSTWIDVGISTCSSRSVKPADCSIIYDTVGNSWHGDP